MLTLTLKSNNVGYTAVSLSYDFMLTYSPSDDVTTNMMSTTPHPPKDPSDIVNVMIQITDLNKLLN